MKIISIISLLILTSNLWAQCPQSRYRFPVKNNNYTKIVLVPGAGSEDDDLYLGHIRYGKYFEAFTDELSRKNIPYTVINSSSTGNESVEVRVKKLIRHLTNENERVLLIGHSMGGLVSRLALRNPSAAQKVAATVTISAPHEGTPIADWLLTDGFYSTSTRNLAKALGFNPEDKNYLRELSVADKSKWNTHQDHQGHITNLFSVVAAQTPKDLLATNPLFALGDSVLRKLTSAKGGRFSDGLVTQDSQSWGECLLYLDENHGSVIGIDILRPSSIEVLPTILESLSKRGIVLQ